MKSWSIWFPIVLLAGCGIGGVSRYDYAMNGVKLIAKSISNNQDSRAIRQDRYELNPEQRLLLRLEDLMDRQAHIATDHSDGISVEVTVAEGERNRLKLCPLTTQWMMLATWNYAHPFGGRGRWQNEGGDFDPDRCMLPGNHTATRARFNITQWFLNYPRARGVNLGLILVASDSVVIFGDASPLEFPRITYAQGSAGSRSND